MADNVTLPGTGTIVASDDVGGVQYQVMKLDVGGNGTSSLVNGSVPVNQANDAISIATADATASGDNTIYTPTSGKAVRLYFISLSANGGNTGDVTAIIKIGATTLYKLSLKPGAIWSRNIGAGRKQYTGATNGAVIVNLSAAFTVHTNIEYEEI